MLSHKNVTIKVTELLEKQLTLIVHVYDIDSKFHYPSCQILCRTQQFCK